MVRRRWQWLVLLCCSLGALSPASAQPVSVSEGSDLVVLLDRSRSMRQTDPRGLSKALTLYVIDQVELASDNNRAAIVPFSTEVVPLMPALSADFDALRQQLAQIPTPDGLTDLEMALKTAYKLLAPIDDGRRKQVVALTDGLPNPDPADRDRFPDIAEQFRKRAERLRPDSLAYRNLEIEFAGKAKDRSIKTIETAVLSGFEGKIEVYPIGLKSALTDQEFLKRIALRTARTEQAFALVEDTRELVLAAERIAYKGDQHLLLVRERVEGRATGYNKDFLVDPHLTKARIVIYYLDESVKAEDFELTLTAPGGERVTRESGRYLNARDRDGTGGAVFERFFLDNVAKGTWRVAIKSRRATRVLPRFELLIEGRTNLKLAVEANPSEIQVPGPVELRAVLSDPEGHPSAIARATGEVRDRTGQVLPLSFKVEAGGVAVARLDLPPQPLGDYLAAVRAFIRPDDPSGVGGRTHFLAKPLEPVQLSVVIPYGPPDPGEKPGGKSLHREKLVFPPVGDHTLSASINKIAVENSSRRPAPVSLELHSITHKDGDLLDPAAWFQIRPTQGISSQSQHFFFDLIARVPARVPGSLLNGLYSGTLRVNAPETGLPVEVPVELTLAVPDLILADPDPADGIKLSFWWQRPAQKTKQFSVRTNSAARQKARVLVLPNLTNADGEAVDPKKLGLLGGSKDLIIEPGKVANIRIAALAGMKDVPAGLYRGEVFLDGERARDLALPVVVEIPSWQAIQYAQWTALLIAAVMLGLVLWFLNQMRIRRGLFPGQHLELRRRDFNNGAYTFPRGFTLSFDPDGENYTLDDPLGATQVTSLGDPCSLPCALEQGHEIRTEQFRFRVQRVSPNLIRLGTLGSPHSRHLPATVICGMLCVALLVLFYLWTFP